ncbi:MAG: hypothetical protein M3O23_09855 [Actinomycetota bacterium]|nr:hypothetical protein [Actinomycetota bacterium]
MPLRLPVRAPDDLAFMLIDGRIARVDVGHTGPEVKTVSGIGKGSTEDESSGRTR